MTEACLALRPCSSTPSAAPWPARAGRSLWRPSQHRRVRMRNSETEKSWAADLSRTVSGPSLMAKTSRKSAARKSYSDTRLVRLQGVRRLLQNPVYCNPDRRGASDDLIDRVRLAREAKIYAMRALFRKGTADKEHELARANAENGSQANQKP